jgi:hypothetical protein
LPQSTILTPGRNRNGAKSSVKEMVGKSLIYLDATL